MSAPSAYELQRLDNINANRAVLIQLGLEKQPCADDDTERRKQPRRTYKSSDAHERRFSPRFQGIERTINYASLDKIVDDVDKRIERQDKKAKKAKLYQNKIQKQPKPPKVQFRPTCTTLPASEFRGMVQCPVCGMRLSGTSNGGVRKHDPAPSWRISNPTWEKCPGGKDGRLYQQFQSVSSGEV